MTDLHTHILPGMDDGAPDAETGLEMLRMERAQGVDTVALTPHFYCEEESVDSFLRRREAAQARLEKMIAGASDGERLPQRILGAEVAWSLHMDRWAKIDRLCYANTNYLLLELPFFAWSGAMFHSLYEMMDRTGITPVIAHIDRYWKRIDSHAMDELLSMGLPVQISTAALKDWRTRGAAVRFLRRRGAQMLISDAHGDRERAPDMAEAMKILRRRDRAAHDALAAFSLPTAQETRP